MSNIRTLSDIQQESAVGMASFIKKMVKLRESSLEAVTQNENIKRFRREKESEIDLALEKQENDPALKKKRIAKKAEKDAEKRAAAEEIKKEGREEQAKWDSNFYYRTSAALSR